MTVRRWIRCGPLNACGVLAGGGMRGMVLQARQGRAGDGDGEHPLPGPGFPLRGWTEGRRGDSAGGLRGNRDGTVRPPPLRLCRYLPWATWAYSSGPQAPVRMSKSPDGPESVGDLHGRDDGKAKRMPAPANAGFAADSRGARHPGVINVNVYAPFGWRVAACVTEPRQPLTIK